MSDLKSVIARNIADLRKSMNWTQAELAQKLNYTDKAISKWERAESTPDVAVLKGMADLFEVSINYLFEHEHPKDHGPFAPMVTKQKMRNRLIIALVSAAGIFLMATILYVILGLFSITVCDPSWMLYIYAIPVAMIVLLIFNSIWGRKKINLAIITGIIWSVLLSIYLSFQADNIWTIFLIGIPAQIIVLLLIPIKPIKLSMLVRPWHHK
jgi:transcriptional regulator with XRE-family HTH domain